MTRDAKYRMRRPSLALVIGLLLPTAGTLAGETPGLPPEALAAIRLMPIQHNGRHKPFDSFARETVDHMTGSPRIGREDPVVTVVSMIAQPERWHARPLLAVPYGPLREALGMDPNASHISHEELVTTRRLMRSLPPIVEKERRDDKLTMLEQETMDLFDRFVAFSNLVEHRLELVPPPPASAEGGSAPNAGPFRPAGGGGMVPSPSVGEVTWRSIQRPEGYAAAQRADIAAAWTAWVTALRGGPPEAISAATTQLARTLRGLNPTTEPPAWRLRLEVGYNRFGPFRVARVLYVVAAVGLLIGLIAAAQPAAMGGMVPPPAGAPMAHAATRRSLSATPAGGGMAVFGLAAALHAAGILLRVVIGGRPPVSNFFETMLWLPFVGVALALVFERIYRAGYVALSASVLSAMMLWLSDAVPLDASISPVVAVLRSHLWLTVHVLTIVASYGALALATVLAHGYGILQVIRRGAHPALPLLDLLVYRSVQVGVVLLAGGVMLGAVWANASWGRYWGWDPKETWALITLLWFLAALHGRFAGWLKGAGFCLAVIGGFFLLLMTYYGVSFYLVGLHSYAGGHAKPLPTLLVAYLIAELAFMALVGLFAMTSRQPS
jgi:cytochrome c-type biogenesis protein CcsB